MPDTAHNRKRTRRYFLLIAISLSGLFLTIWCVSLFLQYRIKLETQKVKVKSETNTLHDRIASEIKYFINDLFIAERAPALTRFYKTRNNNDRREAIQDYIVQVEENPRISQIRYIDNSGKEVIRIDRVGKRAVAVPYAELQNKSERYYFINTIKLNLGQVYVSPMDLNVEHGKIQTPWVPTVRLATPYSADGKHKSGIVIVNFDASDILSLVKQAGGNDQHFMFLNDSGYWLAGAQRDKLWGFMFQKPTTLAKEEPWLWKRLQSIQSGSFHYHGNLYTKKQINIKHQIVADSRLRREVINDNVWQIVNVAGLPKFIVWTSTNISIVLLIMALIIGVSWHWSRSIVREMIAREHTRHAEKQLLRSERMASLGSLVAGVAHELNTPIGNAVTIISTLSDHVEEIKTDIAKGQLKKSSIIKFVDEVNTGTEFSLRNLHRADDLVKKFKEVAVDQANEKRRSFMLDEYVAEVMDTVNPRFKHTKIRLITDLKSHAKLDSYPGALAQVLINLINNALIHGYAETDSGTILVETRDEKNKQVKIVVTDSGKGIQAHLINQIFDPFFTTRLGQGGSGLGLNIVRNIVTNMLGGDIFVESEPNVFTVFQIVIPISAPDQDSAKDPHYVTNIAV